MRTFLLLVALTSQAFGAPCAAELPSPDVMSPEDVACYFVDALRAHRQLKAALTMSVISAAASGAAAGFDSATAASMDVKDLDGFVDYLETKDSESDNQAAAASAIASAGTMAGQMAAIERYIRTSPAFGRYMAQRGLSDGETAWKMLHIDAKKLWRSSERRERRIAARARARDKRDSLRAYRRLDEEERVGWTAR